MEATGMTVDKLTHSGHVRQNLRAVRAVICDKEVEFCEHLQKVLEPQRRIEIVGKAHDTDSLLRLSKEQQPHILLIGHSVSLELSVRGRRSESGPPELIMLDVPEKNKIIESFRLGAKGIILKESQARIWWKGIGAVLAGQYWLGNESLAVLVQAIRDSPIQERGNGAARHVGLTPREIEIVQRIADGRSNREVGEECSIRERTVKHHLTNIFEKVGVSSRLELALFAREHQIFARSEAVEASETSGRDDPQFVRRRSRPADQEDSGINSRASEEV